MEDFPIWYPLTVRVKATGDTMLIKSTKFNPELFEKIEEKQVEKGTTNEPKASPDYFCSPCNKILKREQDLKTHNKRIHGS